MFVNSCINAIIITLFYTNCTRGLAKTKLHLNGAKKFSIGGRPPRPPSKYAPEQLAYSLLYMVAQKLLHQIEKLTTGNNVFTV